MLLLSSAAGQRTAYLGPLEDAAFVATAASVWALYTRGWLLGSVLRADTGRSGLLRSGGRRARRPQLRRWQSRNVARRVSLAW